MYYFWDGEQVLENDIGKTGIVTGPQLMKNGYANLFCLDAYAASDQSRYGRFRSPVGTWEHVPLNQFPKEFRLHLMIRGLI